MTLPETMTAPMIALAAFVGLGVLILVLRSLRDLSRPKSSGAADMIAAVKAERDVLRANHAVEVATLEHKLAAAQARVQEGADANLRTKEAEHRVQSALAKVAELTAEVERLREAAGASAGAAAASPPDEGALAALREREERLQRQLRERSETIDELRAALSRGDSASGAEELATLRADLSAAEARERTANESLSSLAYDRDGLMARLMSAERVAGEANASAEQKEALLELRLQKIHDLKSRVREESDRRMEAVRRADAAAAQAVSGTPGGDGQGEAMAARIKELQRTVEQLTEQNRALADAQREGNAPSDREADELRAALDRLARENQELKAAAHAPALDAEGIAALKASLKSIAERFAQAAEAAEGEDAHAQEPTLADRIRAFKAERAARAAQERA